MSWEHEDPAALSGESLSGPCVFLFASSLSSNSSVLFFSFLGTVSGFERPIARDVPTCLAFRVRRRQISVGLLLSVSCGCADCIICSS